MIFLFLSTILSQIVLLQGEWGNTYPSEEAEAFFEYLHPELLPKVQPILRDIKNSQIEEVIRKLNGIVDPQILNLLEFALKTRYFNPKAISKVHEKRENITLNMWGAVKREWGSNLDQQTILKLIQLTMEGGQFREKIDKLRTVTRSYSQHSEFIQQVTLNSDSEKYKYLPSGQQFASVNGRVVKFDAMEIIGAIFQEYKLINTIRSLNIVNTNFLYQRPGRHVYHWSPPCEFAPVLEYHEMWRPRSYWAKNLSPNPNYMEFLKYKDNLVETQIFMRVGNPNIAYVMETIRNMANAQYPARFHLFLYGNMSDPKERLWVSTFWRVCDNSGPRIGATFLFEAITMGFKKAYKRTTCETSWRKVKDLYKDEAIKRRADHVWDYCNRHNIKGFAYNVNGEFFYDDDAFEKFNDRILVTSKRLQHAMKQGLKTDDLNFQEWYKSDGLFVSGRPPIEIRAENRLTISDKNSGVIENALIYLYRTNEPRNDVDKGKCPVFLIGYKNTSYTDTNNTYIYKVNSIEPQAKDFFGDVKTIIGPFVFKEELSYEQICYVSRRVNYTYHHNLPNTNLLQRHFIEIFRAEEDFANRKRDEKPPLNKDTLVKSRQGEVTLTLVANFALRTIWPIADLMSMLSDVELVGIDLYPSAIAQDHDSIKQISTGKYYPAFETQIVDIPSKDFSIYRPLTWELRHQNGNFSVPGIIVTGYVEKVSIIKIKDEYRKPFETGYFAVVLPPGSHDCQGFESNKFLVDSFIPEIKIYKPGKTVDDIPTNNNAALFMFMWYSDSYWRSRASMYTFLSNCSAKTVFLLDPFVSIFAPKDCVTFVLPIFMPHFGPKPSNNLLFVKGGKYYYPGLLMHSFYDKIIFADEALIFRGDGTRLARVDWKNASVCAIESADKNKNSNINSWSLKTLRIGRPFHTPALLCYCVSMYTKQRGPEYYLDLSKTKARARTTMGFGDEEYLNLLQLKVQFLTLPSTVVFDAQFMKRKLARNALAHVRSCDNSEKWLGTKARVLNKDVENYFNEL